MTGTKKDIEERTKRILALRKEGLPIKEIANRVALSKSAVNKCLLDNGMRTIDRSLKLTPKLRREKIKGILEENPSITTKELVVMFLSSETSIREDLRAIRGNETTATDELDREIRRERVRDLVARDVPTKDIAESLNVSTETVNKDMRILGIKRIGLSPKETSEIVRKANEWLYRRYTSQGLTPEQIALILNKPNVHVRKDLERLGLV